MNPRFDWVIRSNQYYNKILMNKKTPGIAERTQNKLPCNISHCKSFCHNRHKALLELQKDPSVGSQVVSDLNDMLLHEHDTIFDVLLCDNQFSDPLNDLHEVNRVFPEIEAHLVDD